MFSTIWNIIKGHLCISATLSSGINITNKQHPYNNIYLILTQVAHITKYYLNIIVLIKKVMNVFEIDGIKLGWAVICLFI